MRVSVSGKSTFILTAPPLRRTIKPAILPPKPYEPEPNSQTPPSERTTLPAFNSVLQLPEVRRVYLEDFSHETNGIKSLITLIVCPPEQTALHARRLVAQPAAPLSPSLWLNFIETILVYKLPQLTREEIQRMIGIQDIDIKSTRFYQDVFSEGLEEGIEEGREEGERLVLQRILERKFGTLGDAEQNPLRQANADTLLAWCERILDARTINEVFSTRP